MDAKNLTWKQIKELLQIAIENGCEFKLVISKDNDMCINIFKLDPPYTTYPTYPTPIVSTTTTTPLNTIAE